MHTNVGMAALTLVQEYAAVREAIQTLSTTGTPVASFSVDGVQVSYTQNQLPWLETREQTLAKMINIRNVRKRTLTDFT
jgi:uncharacterized membrane protein